METFSASRNFLIETFCQDFYIFHSKEIYGNHALDIPAKFEFLFDTHLRLSTLNEIKTNFFYFFLAIHICYIKCKRR